MDLEKEKFLQELAALTLKYRIEIGGCGCCGSPWISPMTEDDTRDKYQLSGLDGLELTN